MSIRLYKVTGQYEAYVLAHKASDAVDHAGRERRESERVHEVTAVLADVASGPLETRVPQLAFVHSIELDARGMWNAKQWAVAAPADAAAEADRLRAEAADCDLRAARLRAEAEELAKVAARARGAGTVQEPEPSEANRVAAYLGALRETGPIGPECFGGSDYPDGAP